MAGVAGRGFSSLWLPQSSGFDALTVLALVGQVSGDVELGTSVVPTYPVIRSRSPRRHSP